MAGRRFELPDDRGIVHFKEDALEHMYLHAQIKFWQSEAGGQLFCRSPDHRDVIIDLVTGPYPEDQRSRHGFNPDVRIANNDRQERFIEGYYAVGLWHTHPEPNPLPSNKDRQTASKYLAAFKGEMEGFLLAIVGNKGNPPVLNVWMAAIKASSQWVNLDEL